MQKQVISKKQKFWPYWLAIFVVALAVPFSTYAGGAGETLGVAVGNLLYFLLFKPFVLLLQIELIILPKLAQYNDFTSVQGVEDGWKALRDLSNMFFIVILLIMSFATILKFEAYGYKQVLRKLILMAILINFSKTIVGLVIDFFQLIMLTFVATWKDVAAGNITSALGLDRIATFKNSGKEVTGDEAGFLEIFASIVAAYLFAGIFLILTCIVVFGFIFMLLARIIMFWILVVLSPLAFLANAFPATQQYFSQWMSALTKELIVGPVMAFFLWLSFTIVGGSASKKNIQDTMNGIQSRQTNPSGMATETEQATLEPNIGNITEATSPTNVLTYLIGIAMLIGSLKVTQSIGGVASGMGSKAATAAKGAVVGAAAWGGMKMWKGSSGYGGIKGGMQRVTAKVGAGALETAGQISGIKAFTRGGLSLRQGERNRKTEKREAMLKDTKGMTAAEQREYLGGASIYARGAVDKVDIAEGTIGKRDEAEIQSAMARFEKINDKESLKAIRAKSGHAYSLPGGEQRAREAIEENGAAAVSKLDPNTIIDPITNTLTTGGQAVIAAVTSQLQPEQIDNMLKGMTEQTAAAWRRAIGEFGVNRFSASGGTLARRPAVGGAPAALDTDDPTYRAATLDNRVFTEVMADASLTEVERNRLASARAARMSNNQALSFATAAADPAADPNTLTAWQSIGSHLTEAQQNHIAATGTPAVSQAVVRVGDLNRVLNNQNLTQSLRGVDTQPDIEFNITNQMTSRAIAPGSPDETNFRNGLAGRNLANAHLMFGAPGSATADANFANFIQTLDVNRALQLDSAQLKRLIRSGHVTDANFLTALRTRGFVA